jgi:hypothetical protein
VNRLLIRIITDNWHKQRSSLPASTEPRSVGTGGRDAWVCSDRWPHGTLPFRMLKSIMATNVCLAVISDEGSRFVVGTCPAATGLHKLLWGSAQIDRSAEMIEGWVFDAEAGVLRVAAAPGSAAPVREIPLSLLVNLTWGGVHETRLSDESFHYELRLFFDDGGRPTFLNLPGSADYLCASSDQPRDVERCLRAFLKPHCPQLESTTLEELAKFWHNPVAGVQSLQQIVETRLTALDSLSGRSASASSGQFESDPSSDPTASAREMLTQLHSALGRLGEAAAEQQRKRAEPDGQLTGGWSRLIVFLVVIAVGAAIGLWLMGN